jgi:hypothetical protein
VSYPPWLQLWDAIRPLLELKGEGRPDADGWVWARCIDAAKHKNGDAHFSLRINTRSGGVRCMSQGCAVGPNMNNLAERLGVDGHRDGERPAPGEAMRRLAEKRLLPQAALHDEYGVRAVSGGWAFPVDDPDAEGHPHIKRFSWWLGEPRFWWPKGSRVRANDCVYGLTHVAEGTGSVYVAAGEIDCITLLEAGYPAVSFLTGESGEPSTRAIRKLIDRGIGAVCLVYDLDDAGREGALKTGSACARQGLQVHLLTLPEDLGEGGDVNDLWRRCGGDRDTFVQALEACPTTPLEEPTIPGSQAETAAQPFEAKSLDALLAEEDEALDVVISDGADGAALTADGKGFIAGPTGVGKTNLLLRLSRCLCEGSPFLALTIPRPCRVLYLALEGSEWGIRRRLRKVWGGADPEARQRFSLAQITFSLASEDDLKRLEALLRSARPEVLIIDPLRNAHPFDENASHEAAGLTAILDGIIARHRCAIICAHHDRKRPPFVRRDAGTDRVRGSTALTGWLSFCLSIDLDPKTPDLLLAEWTKTRDAELPLPSLVLEFDRDTLDFIPSDRAPGGKVSDEAILNAVFHSGGSIRGPDLIRGLVEGCGAGERSVRERIRVLVKEGRLIDFVAEADRATRAKSYMLPDPEENQ